MSAVATVAGRPRFGHGSRVPGWDDAVDLTKDPAVIPDPATTPVPDELRARDRGGDGQVPGPPLGGDPGAARRPGASRLVLAGGDRPGRRGDAADAGLPDLGGQLLRHARDRAPAAAPRRLRVHEHLVLAARRRRAVRRDGRGRRRRPRRSHVRSFECLGACDIAPMASVDGEYVGPLEPDDAEQIVEDLRAGRAGARDKQLRYRQSSTPACSPAPRSSRRRRRRPRPTPPGCPSRGERPPGRRRRSRPARSREDDT